MVPPARRHELLEHHRLMLERDSGISADVVAERGYYTALDWHDLQDTAFRGGQKVPGTFPWLIIPQYGPGGEHVYDVARPDLPAVDSTGRVKKYLQPAGVGHRLDVPQRCRAFLGDADAPLWFTEGSRKADSLASRGVVVVSTPGVESWGGPSAIPDMRGIAWAERRIIVAYDSDAMTKSAVRRAVLSLALWLRQRSADVYVLDWARADLSGLGDKVGVDDFLAAGHELQALEALAVPFDSWRSPAGPAAPGEGAHRPLTDLGNAERLIAQHGADLHYCWPWQAWLTWDTTHWHIDDTGGVLHRAETTVRTIYAEAEGESDGEKRKAIASWAMKSEAQARIEAMIGLARAAPGVPVLPSHLDTDLWLLNTPTGTVDLRTGLLRPHERSDLITKVTAAEYNPTAAAPVWDGFLARVQPDPELRLFLQRAAGYAATGDTSEQVMFMHHGGGSNGKSTFINALLGVLGAYAKRAAADLLTLNRNEPHPTGLADLVGVRLAVSIEVEEGRRLAEVLVKEMTGGDRLKARFMHRDFFEFQPQHKIMLVTNHKPVVRGADLAIWRRIRLVPWGETIAEAERDPQLAERLRPEFSGILAWLVAGCLEWQQTGLGTPEAVRSATASYRDESDVIGEFLAERCVVEDTARASVSEIYTAYGGWCENSGERSVAKNVFSGRLTERGFESYRTERARWWIGLRLRRDTDDDMALGA